MKLKFKTQAYQAAAVQAVVDCFSGQPSAHEATAYRIAFHQPGKGEEDRSEYGFKNGDLALTDAQLLQNIQQVQRARNLPVSDALVKTKITGINLDIEMETGTGKTYCYIKTIFELNRCYGWNKFVIVVPSIAIREGVARSIEITAEHFLETYRKKARFFAYNSRQLHSLESFSSDAGINIMIINAQAFAARSADNRRIYELLDDFQSRRPIDVISANRPILILDEPQKMEGAQTLESLEAFNALMVLRYSATHKTTHNKIHQLDALEAYNQKLVKKIAVRGIAIKGFTGTAGYLYLESIDISDKRPPEARVEFERKVAAGRVKRIARKLGKGDNVFELSGGLEQYGNGFVVANIDASTGMLSFTNGLQLTAGDAIGDVSETTLRRIQIREAIKAHFDKEQALFQQGVKVLTLYFIDEVVKYRDYAADDGKGEYARIFEDEYGRCLNDILGVNDTPYTRYLKGIPVDRTHAGYFSIDKKTRRMTDPALAVRGENAGSSDDVEAYRLILKDQERLLSLAEPVRFIFSHSALREGWDNPNVFVICALKHSDNTVSRRQEVGRGLRLSVNQNGDRMDHPAIVHNVNVLTVVAGESYKNFVAALQRDVEPLSARPPAANETRYTESRLPEIEDDRRFKMNPLNANFETREFKALWDRINRKAVYKVEFDSNDLVRKAVTALNDQRSGLRVIPLQYTIQHGEQATAMTHGIKKSSAFELSATQTEADRPSTHSLSAHSTATHSTVKYDLIGKLSEGTRLTRRTIAEILKGLDAAVFAQFKINPESFIAEAVRLIDEQKAAVITDRLTYHPVDDRFDLDIFTAEQTRRAFGQAGKKLQRHIYDYVISDSSIEREFVEALDASSEVAVYAKLPRAFLIPTPVGDYTPGWAIAFKEGSVKHVYFVADTKSVMPPLARQEIQRIRIECARKFFEGINRHHSPGGIQYGEVDSFEKMMEVVRAEPNVRRKRRPQRQG